MTSARLRYRGPITSLSRDDESRLFLRGVGRDDVVRSRTTAILERVRRDGDRALVELARELDHVNLDAIEIPRAEWRAALAALPPELNQAMSRAARNLASAHRAQLPQAIETETEPGILVGRRPDPLARVGIYAPGGRASYPSSVLMAAIPAKLALVGEIVLCSPPDRTGRPSPAVLAAAELAEVDRVFAIGGAGAIAAMAYGTDTVPCVDRIVGPGNAYVAEAKLQVCDRVSIDSPAGPSELLALADQTVDPEFVAREILAQAEHDPDACSLAVAIGNQTAERIEAAVLRAIPEQARRAIIEEALAANGGVLVASCIEDAIRFANRYAPEHLLIATSDPAAAFARIRNAGAVFLGGASSVAFGDYLTGANHTLPTAGTARSYSGLSTLDFVRWTSYQRVSPEAAARLARDVESFASAERLDAHARAAAAWNAASTKQRSEAAAERRP